MFTDKTQTIIDLAKDYAWANDSTEMTLASLISAVVNQIEVTMLLAECVNASPEQIGNEFQDSPKPSKCVKTLPLTEDVHSVLTDANELAGEVPDRFHPGLIDVRHLVCALATCQKACAILNIKSITHKKALEILTYWYAKEMKSPALEELTERLRVMRTDLLSKVFGQDHAVHAFTEGLFNADVVACSDVKRNSPQAFFVFAGPPGVGKTYLAELGASHLNRPFKRFDMSTYSDHQQHTALVGWAKSYQGAHPGKLTEYVEKNPNAVLLFDEIEKCHINTIHLFLQILDAGTLEDKYHERNISFRDTIIIFTTNAGRAIYNRPNTTGVHSANSSFHRKTILDALKNEKDKRTGQPFFPAALCSRMATGYSIMFNHLRVNELERVVRTELTLTAELLERQYYKKVTFDDLLPTCIVLSEGIHTDARTLRSQADIFIKTEIYKFCQLFKTDRLEEVFAQANHVHFVLDEDPQLLEPEICALFEPKELPRILLVADNDLIDLYQEYITEVSWLSASTAEDALELLADEDVDMILLDLWIGRSLHTSSISFQHFDNVPAATRSLDQGQELLRKVRDRLPDVPVFLLSLAESKSDFKDKGSVDDELFIACVRGGGARGMIVSRFFDGMVTNWREYRDQFSFNLIETCRRLHRENAAFQSAQEHKVLVFDTIPHIDKKKKKISIRLRNLRLTRAISAADVGEVMEDIERPRTRFDDIIGADSAKDELKFFIDYLKNPRRFAALGLKPPKGVLLHGPPGTGKTMLARAMAGESDVAFISAAASSFVTVWQGSGPQNIRELFERARRYAPTIIFIDEIDAIGRVRTGSVGAGRSEENTLNALLAEMDGFTSPSPDKPVFILAATNFNTTSERQGTLKSSSRVLDPALVRRFSRTILVDLPDTSARKKYFLMRFNDNQKANITESAFDLLAEKSVGMSIAELEQVIESAGRTAVRKDILINDEILIEALDTLREGEAKEWSPEFLESTARHETGHTIMYWLSGWLSPEVSIVARANHGGGMRRCEADMKRESKTREEMLESIRTSLGGRAAEVLYYGRDKGLTTGASGDLENATNIARQMICQYGMDEDFGLLAIPELFKHVEAISSPAYQQVNEAANKILKAEMDKTMKMLEEHREYMDIVTWELLEKNRLLRCDLEIILPEIGDIAP